MDLTFCCLMFEAAPCMGNGSVIRFGQVHTSLGKARKMSQPGHPGILLNPHFRLLSSPLALCSFLLLQWGIPTESADWSFTQAFFKSEHQIRHGLLSGDFPSVLRQIWRAVNRVPRHCFGGCRRHLECIDFVNNGALLFSLFLRLGITAVLQLADGVPVILGEKAKPGPVRSSFNNPFMMQMFVEGLECARLCSDIGDKMAAKRE